MVCHWYVATTHHSQEQRAARELSKQAWTTSLPMARVEVRRPDGLLVDVVRPLFQGYLFVKFDPKADPWKRVCYTRGVRGLLGYQPGTDSPMAVPPDEMDVLFARLAEHGGVITLNTSRPKHFEPDMLIKVLFGPYRDRHALVQADHGSRVDVLLRFLGAKRIIPIRKDYVELAGEPALVDHEGRRAVATPKRIKAA